MVKEVNKMISFRRWVQLITVLLILTLLFIFGSGCTTYKEAVAAPVKTAPVHAETPPSPATKVKK
jgi:TRAP-type C4-dicarboxylate transport system permease small subunit